LTHAINAKQGGFLMDAIKWNFTKFVVDKEGQPKARFAPTDDPIPKVEEECKNISNSSQRQIYTT